MRRALRAAAAVVALAAASPAPPPLAAVGQLQPEQVIPAPPQKSEPAAPAPTPAQRPTNVVIFRRRRVDDVEQDGNPATRGVPPAAFTHGQRRRRR